MLLRELQIQADATDPNGALARALGQEERERPALGRSRGGLTSKIHLVAGDRARPLT
jgi:hypothetical protein